MADTPILRAVLEGYCETDTEYSDNEEEKDMYNVNTFQVNIEGKIHDIETVMNETTEQVTKTVQLIERNRKVIAVASNVLDGMRKRKTEYDVTVFSDVSDDDNDDDNAAAAGKSPLSPKSTRKLKWNDKCNNRTCESIGYFVDDQCPECLELLENLPEGINPLKKKKEKKPFPATLNEYPESILQDDTDEAGDDDKSEDDAMTRDEYREKYHM